MKMTFNEKLCIIALAMFVGLMTISALSACSSPDNRYTAAPFWLNRIDGTTPTNHFELLCDEAMDVTYIKMGYNKGGITVRVDSTGAPVRCSSIRSRRRR